VTATTTEKQGCFEDGERINGYGARVGVRFDTASPVNARLWGGEAVCFDRLSTTRAAGCGWSTDFVTESRTGTDDGARVAGGSPLWGVSILV